MSIQIINSEESLIARTGDLLLAGGVEGAKDHIVVFPGKRPSHFLLKYLGDKLGAAFEPPEIFSMDGFIDHLAKRSGVKSPEISSLDAVGVLYDHMRQDLLGVIGKEKEVPLDNFLPWGFKIFSDFEELKIELKTPGELKNFDSILPAEVKGSDAFIRKISSFSKVYERFYARLEKEGLLTRSLKYAAASENIESIGFGNKKIIMAGFFALTAVEKRIFTAVSKLPGSVILLQDGPGLKEQFAFLGGCPAAALSHKPSVLLRFYKAPDVHGEVFSLSGLLKGRPLSSRDAVVLPSPDALFPVLFNVLGEVKDYNISMGYPLTATPVFSLIDSLGDLLEKRSGGQYFTSNYLKFVFHPYVKNIYFRPQEPMSEGGLQRSAEPTRVIFQVIEEKLISKINKYLALEDLENDMELFEKCAQILGNRAGSGPGAREIREHVSNIHNRLIRPLEKPGSIKDFADRIMDVIAFISGNSTANLHPYSAPFIEKLYEELHAFSASKLAGRRLENISSCFKLLKSCVKSSVYPFSGTPLSGLQVLGALETRCLKFDSVYFLDANSDILPGTKKEDTVLSHFIRRGLGLSTYKTREASAKYYFSLLVSQAREAHIFYKDSPELEKSPFVQKLLWDLKAARQDAKEQEVHFRLDFSQRDPRPIAKSGELSACLNNFTFSPSSLDAYLACGLKFYYQYALRLKEKDEAADEMGQAEIGSIVHKILELVFREYKPGKGTELSRAAEIAEKVFNAELKNHDCGYEYLVKKQILRRLKDIILYHRENMGEARVKSCEKDFVFEFEGVKFSGRADRIDLRPLENGRNAHVIVDYKTGSAVKTPNLKKFELEDRASWPGTLRSVQLPLYVMFYLAENPDIGLEDVDACLMLLGSHKISEEFLFGGSADKAADFARLKKAVSCLVREIRSPALDFEPAADIKTCGFCPFKAMCGRQWA